MDNNGVKPPGGSMDLGPTLHGLDFALCGISVLFVAVRIFTRLRITKDLGWDDWTILIAIALVCTGKALVYMEVVFALGRHKSQVTAAAYRWYLKYDMIDWAQTVLVLAFSKISIGFFLLRLTHFHRLRYAIWGLIIFTLASHIPFAIALLLRCNPVNKHWNEDLPGTCHPKKRAEIIIIVQGVLSIITDVLCAGCPIVLLYNAKIKRKIKIQLCLLMGFGFLTAVACCVRTGFSYQILSPDMSWVAVPNAISRMIEVNMGIWAACAPVMKPFSRFIRIRFFKADSRILHPSLTNLSFWHRSWWRPSTTDEKSRSRSGDQSTANKKITVNKTVDISHAPKRPKPSNARSARNFLIPSIVLGEEYHRNKTMTSHLFDDSNGSSNQTPNTDLESGSGDRDVISYLWHPK